MTHRDNFERKLREGTPRDGFQTVCVWQLWTEISYCFVLPHLPKPHPRSPASYQPAHRHRARLSFRNPLRVRAWRSSNRRITATVLICEMETWFIAHVGFFWSAVNQAVFSPRCLLFLYCQSMWQGGDGLLKPDPPPNINSNSSVMKTMCVCVCVCTTSGWINELALNRSLPSTFFCGVETNHWPVLSAAIWWAVSDNRHAKSLYSTDTALYSTSMCSYYYVLVCVCA